MRLLPVALSLAAATGALAQSAAPAPPPTWADYVGDWQGKLRWTGCGGEGADRAAIAIDATDGVVFVDLSAAGGALPRLTLVEDDGGWSGQQGDVRVRVKRATKGDLLELAVDLDSGCEVRATLARPTVGIAACDRLAAWARIEAQCTRLVRPPLENAARLARQRAQWTKATGETRDKLATQCAARATKVETSLIDTGCAPSPDPAIGLRGAECQALQVAAGRISRCGNVPPDLRGALEREVVVLVAAAQGADKAALPVVEAECRRIRERLVTVGKHAGCPLH
jgi:hypothetical protein